MNEQNYIKKDVDLLEYENLDALDDVFDLLRGGKPERPRSKIC